jgi:CMP-N,N'-diacetyllegionaminic acid synthase|tara:strand:- start:138 stop:845 length:708 start_codon:yes stop_codon:yes gene_type:complete
MKKRYNIISIICVRKNSKGLKNKNLMKIGNKSLLSHTIFAAKKSQYISKVYVSTDCNKIKKEANKHGALTPFKRPKNLSGDNVTSEKVLQHALINIENNSKKNIDYVLYLQVTEPFRPKLIIDNCIKKIIRNRKLDTVFAAKSYKKNIWYKKNNSLIRLNSFEKYGLPRQKKKLLLREDTGVACISKASIIRNGSRIGKKVDVVLYEHDFDYIDIHNKNDLLISNFIQKKDLFKS